MIRRFVIFGASGDPISRYLLRVFAPTAEALAAIGLPAVVKPCELPMPINVKLEQAAIFT
jgi:hypothetical protein